MGSTEKILFIICGIGTVLLAINMVQIVIQKGGAKSSIGVRAAGNMLILPYATSCVLNKDTGWTVIFVLMLLSGLEAIFSLASNNKEK